MSRSTSLVFLRTLTAAGLGAACLLALSGCAAVEVRLGTRVYLSKTPVTSMQAKVAQGTGIAPGQKLPLIVSFTAPDDKVLMTEGAGKGKILWQDLTVTATVATVDKKGNVSLPRDPRISDGKVPHVVITAPSHPDLHAELDIPVNYDYNYSSTFSGSSGSSGLPGSDGIDGSSGMSGSIDPDNPSPGGSGSNGGSGSDGGSGGNGGDGPSVQVRVALKSETHPLLQIGVTAQAGHERLYLVDPQGGTLTVKSLGGPGGSGGKGGRGGRGGSGGMGSPPGSDGNSGLDGHDGFDGSAGSGGSIIVTYDPQVKAYLGAIKTSNPGGPAPVFREQPVAALW
jgi:hypothetical protein